MNNLKTSRTEIQISDGVPASSTGSAQRVACGGLTTTSRLLWAVLAAAAAVALTQSVKADQQGYPSLITSLTNLPAVQSNGVVSLWTTNYIPLRQTGLGAQLVFTGSNLVTAPMSVYFYPTSDGTNAWTTPFALLQVPCNGTNLVVGGTNWSRYTLQGFTGFFVTVSNGTGDNVLLNTLQTNYVTGVTNILGCLWFNRPNQ